MSVLVIGGTGTVGRHVVAGLRAKGETVRVLTRRPEKVRDGMQGAEAVEGDLLDPAGLDRALDGTKAMALITAVGPKEAEEGRNAAEAARRAGCSRVVQMSVFLPPGAETIPHFASKLPIEEAVRRSAEQWTILRPNCFMQNDLLYREAMSRHGVYPQPLGHRGVNLVDVRDIADAMVTALTEAGYDGRLVEIHGPEALTAQGVAENWSQGLGREIHALDDDVQAWAGLVAPHLPEAVLPDLVTMFEFFVEKGLEADDAALQAQRPLLGHAPRTHAAFVAEAVASD